LHELKNNWVLKIIGFYNVGTTFTVAPTTTKIQIFLTKYLFTMPIYRLFFSLCLFAACNAQNQPKNQISAFAPKQAHYYLRFVETSAQLHTEISFFADTGSIATPKGLFLNGQDPIPLKPSPNNKNQYKLSKVETAPQPVYWVYYPTNNPADSLRNRDTLSLPLLNKISLAREALSKQTGTAILWQGAALSRQDKIQIQITDSKGETLTINQVGLDGAQNIPIQPQGLDVFANGKGSIKLFIQRIINKNASDFPRQFVTEYYPKEIPIIIQN
jgi:hypothetical protein